MDRGENDLLELPFLEEEIRRELMESDGNKMPSPNGFTFKFIQLFWSNLKGQLMALFNQFFEMADFDQRFSSSFISLISKVANPFCLNEFRPILFMGWVHKLVTGVLAARLKGAIGKLVLDTQFVFIIERNIFDE